MGIKFKQELLFVDDRLQATILAILVVGCAMFIANKFSYNLLKIELREFDLKISWVKSSILSEKTERIIPYDKIIGYNYNTKINAWYLLTIKIEEEEAVRFYNNWDGFEELAEALEKVEWKEKRS